MPQTVMSRLVRATAPASVRLIALATVALGRPLLSHAEAGVSKATWYRHRADADSLLSQAEKNQRQAQSHPENGASANAPPVDKSGHLSTGLAPKKTMCLHADADETPQKRHLSTGQKTINSRELPKKERRSAPFCGGLGPIARTVVETLREHWESARVRSPDLGWLVLDHGSIANLEAHLGDDGGDRVLKVALAALGAAERKEIPGSWWARLFIGQGYAARGAALDGEEAAAHARGKRFARATRPISDIERRILGGYVAGAA